MEHVWQTYVNHTRPSSVLKPSILFFQAILHFVNQNMSTMGLQVADMDKQVTKKTAAEQLSRKEINSF